MNFHVVSLFPEVIDAYAKASILGRAQEENLLSVATHQLRDYADNPAKPDRGAGKWEYKCVDGRPYGGGPGMVLRAEPFIAAVEAIQQKLEVAAKKQSKGKPWKKAKVLITAAGGKELTNAYAKKLSKQGDVIILCGRYEGIDSRAKKVLRAEEVSVGPYILTGGEIPALAIIDATARQIPGALGKFESLEESRVGSHEIYTRPEVLARGGKNYHVPKVLLSGNHAKIDAWKEQKRSNPI